MVDTVSDRERRVKVDCKQMLTSCCHLVVWLAEAEERVQMNLQVEKTIDKRQRGRRAVGEKGEEGQSNRGCSFCMPTVDHGG